MSEYNKGLKMKITTLLIGSDKGGVGKTTTVAMLGSYLAGEMRVLLIDFDPQGHLSLCFGIPKAGNLPEFILRSRPKEKVIVHISKNLSIIPNNHNFVMVEKAIAQTQFSAFFLANLLDSIKGYDIILMDTPPGHTLTRVATLVASKMVLSVTTLNFLDLDGVVSMFSSIATISKIPHVVTPTIIGVLPTFFDLRSKQTLINLAELQRIAGNLLLPPIPRDMKVSEAVSFGKSLWDYAPRCRAAIGYKNYSTVTNSLGRTGGYIHLGEIVRSLL
jgi:chromosome partitioning protein